MLIVVSVLNLGLAFTVGWTVSLRFFLVGKLNHLKEILEKVTDALAIRDVSALRIVLEIQSLRLKSAVTEDVALILSESGVDQISEHQKVVAKVWAFNGARLDEDLLVQLAAQTAHLEAYVDQARKRVQSPVTLVKLLLELGWLGPFFALATTMLVVYFLALFPPF